MAAYLLLARQLYLPLLSAVLAGAGISLALKTFSRFGWFPTDWSLRLPR